MIVNLYVSRDGQQYGPYSLDEARAHLASGSLLPTDYAYHEGLTGWVPLADVISAPTQTASHSAGATPATTTPAKAKKSRRRKAKSKDTGKSSTVGAGAAFQKYKAILAVVVIITTGFYLYSTYKNTNPSQDGDTDSPDAEDEIQDQMGGYEKGDADGGTPAGPVLPGGN